MDEVLSRHVSLLAQGGICQTGSAHCVRTLRRCIMLRGHIIAICCHPHVHSLPSRPPPTRPSQPAQLLQPEPFHQAVHLAVTIEAVLILPTAAAAAVLTVPWAGAACNTALLQQLAVRW
jgi:hypothetical protein